MKAFLALILLLATGCTAVTFAARENRELRDGPLNGCNCSEPYVMEDGKPVCEAILICHTMENRK